MGATVTDAGTDPGGADQCPPGATATGLVYPPCACPGGYELGVEGDAFVCNDVDECTPPSLDRDPCGVGSGGACTNLPGSYQCTACPAGYEVRADELGCAPYRYEQVAVSSGWMCALREDQELECGGNGFAEVTSPPPGPFVTMTLSRLFGCALRPDGRVSCWGDRPPEPPADETFTQLAAGDLFVCGLRRDGGVRCWGLLIDSPEGAFASISAGGAHACGVLETGELSCWGADQDGQATPPPGRYRAVHAHDRYSCAVREDGELACWGDVPEQVRTLPAGEFVEVATADDFACALRRDRSAVCWGTVPSDVPPAAARFRELAVGWLTICGIDEDGGLACWTDHPWG